jgi:hypothetical protein
MTSKVGFNPPTSKPEDQQLYPGDLYIHDMRIALVDPTGHVRGLYEIMHPQMSEVFIDKLHRDVASLLQNKQETYEADKP